MTIWLLGLVLLASLAGFGYRQGAIKVACSLVGILLGAVLAVPLGRLVGRLLVPMGLKDPVLIWALGPLIVFIAISLLAKAAAAALHHKADVYYKYHAGELRLALWERLNHRLGLCVALLNATAYLVLLAFVISVPSYLTAQVATSEKDPKWMRVLNQVGRDLQSTGFDKVARAINTIPQIDYDVADFVALLYHNSLLEARLGLYPPFLALAERPEFAELGNDKDFTEAWQRGDPVMAIFGHYRIQTIWNNPALLKVLWDTVTPDLADLRAYLQTGKTVKYQEKILGRWQFNVAAAMAAMRRAKPNIASSEMLKWKKWMLAAFSQTTLVARTDHQLAMKNAPALRLAAAGNPAAGLQNYQGQWSGQDGKYQVSLGGVDLPGAVEGGRLTLKAEGMDWVFDQED